MVVEDTKVTISGPAAFDLLRLFYLCSEKGDEDIGQYGECFKAAAVCLLRDHGIEPIAIIGAATGISVRNRRFIAPVAGSSKAATKSCCLSN